jgi:hypothetical protein
VKCCRFNHRTLLCVAESSSTAWCSDCPRLPYTMKRENGSRHSTAVLA